MKLDPRQQQSRDAIVETGIRVLNENPSAGMAEIAVAAGIGRATLYRHFDSREKLIVALTRLCLAETDAATAPIKAEGLKGYAAIEATIDALSPLADRFRFLMNAQLFAIEDPEVLRVYKRQLKELSTLIDQAKADGDIRDDLPTAWITMTFDNLLNAAWTLVESGHMSSDAASAALKKTFFHGTGSTERRT